MSQTNVKTVCRYLFGMFGIGALIGLQIYAWNTGHNGTIQALVASGIAGILGSILGFDLGIKKRD